MANSSVGSFLAEQGIRDKSMAITAGKNKNLKIMYCIHA